MTDTYAGVQPARATFLDRAARCLAIGVATALVGLAAGSLVRALGLPTVYPDQGWAGAAETLASRLLVAALLAPLALRLRLPAAQRAGVLFVLLFVVETLLPAVELLFFSAGVAAGVGTGIGVGVVVSAVQAGLLTALLPAPPEDRLEAAAGRALRERAGWSWALRLLAVALLYLPTYLLFGMLVYPFVQPYYTTLASQLHLALPSGEELLALEPARGLVYALAVLPVALVVRGRLRLALLLALVLGTLNAWGPLLTASPWPPQLRLAHGLELTGDSVVQAATMGLLLGLPSRRRESPH